MVKHCDDVSGFGAEASTYTSDAKSAVVATAAKKSLIWILCGALMIQLDEGFETKEQDILMFIHMLLITGKAAY